MKPPSASKTPTTPVKNAILLTVTALALSRSTPSRADALCNCLRYWDASGGDWFNPSNWGPNHNDVPNCAGVLCPPLSGASEVDINNSGTAQISGLTQTAFACEVFLAKASGQSGGLSVNHATLSQCNEMWVGYQGTGTLNITNGGLVTTPLGASIASVTGSNGTVSVDGTNPDGRKSTWTVTNGDLFVGGRNTGAGGTGLLTVTNDARVNAVSISVYPSGTLTGNSMITATSGATIQGTLEPSGGRLTIAGNLTFSGLAPLMPCNVVPSGADNVYVSGGAASLTGRLKVTMIGTFTPGTTYTLLHADGGLTGTRFSSVSISYPTNQCFTPVVTYNANNVYLNLVPCN